MGGGGKDEMGKILNKKFREWRKINDNFGWIWAALHSSVYFLSLLSGDVDSKLSEWSCSSSPIFKNILGIFKAI